MRHAPGRPAGADNFVKWRRTIDEHLELGRLTWDEYGMFSWLCTKADQRPGRGTEQVLIRSPVLPGCSLRRCGGSWGTFDGNDDATADLSSEYLRREMARTERPSAVEPETARSGLWENMEYL